MEDVRSAFVCVFAGLYVCVLMRTHSCLSFYAYVVVGVLGQRREWNGVGMYKIFYSLQMSVGVPVWTISCSLALFWDLKRASFYISIMIFVPGIFFKPSMVAFYQCF